MHRNRSNCVVKVLSLTLLTVAIIALLYVDVVNSSPTPSTTVKSPQKPSTKAPDDEDTVLSLLRLTGSIITSGDDLLKEMNSTLHDAEILLTKNGSREFFYSLPDPFSIDDIKPRIIFYKNGLPSLELPYKMDPREMASSLQSKGFLDTDRLILITHGFHNDLSAPWLAAYKDTILNVSLAAKCDQTVALIGWGGGADLLIFRYRQAAANVVPVGKWLSKIVKAIDDLGMKPQTHIYGIGHSLGAHVMGVAGRESKAFERITGLDPAGPCFEKVNNSQTLYYTDARFVDVIHTDGYDSKLDPSEWVFPVNHYGSLVPIATLDFYPNFGYHQPNAGTFTVAGSHLRALDLFLWSIQNPGKFVTSAVLNGVPDYEIPVDEWVPGKYTVEMGYYADRYQVPPGNFTDNTTLFFIKTNGQVPWV